MHRPERLSILLISHRFPWPLPRGDTLTVYKMAEYFGRRHDLDLLCHEPADPDDAQRLRPMVRSLYCEPFSRPAAAARLLAATFRRIPFQAAWCCSPALRRRTARLLREHHYDVVIPYYLRPAECVRRVQGPAKVVAMQLSLALQWSRAAACARAPLRRLLYQWEAARLRAYEGWLFEDFDRVLLISPRDRDTIPGARDSKIHYNPHGVDTDTFRPDPQTPPQPGAIVMTGAMQFVPNADAACWFVEQIFPRVLARCGEAQLTIVGKDPPPRLRALAGRPHIEVTGWVPDVVPYLRGAAVAVAPMRICAGLQNKVLEAMSAGAPVVMTSAANEGIGAADGVHCLIRDDPEAFAEAVATLMTDDALRSGLSAAARQWIVSHWTWETHFERLDQMLRELVASRAGDLQAAGA